MSAKIIDGKAIAEEIRQKIAEDVKELVDSGGPRPGLATVLVGEDPASQTYVRMKQKACDQNTKSDNPYLQPIAVREF